MRYFFRRRVPPVRRILLIESGSRSLVENLIPGIRSTHGDHVEIDLVTCYAGNPAGFREQSGRVWRVYDYPTSERRGELYAELAQRRHDVIGMICSAEPIMTKWKWSLAARLPSKVFLVNENGDYFWLDWGHWRNIQQFVLFRAGLTGSGAVRTLARVAVFPLTLAYLLLYAATVHLRRKVFS